MEIPARKLAFRKVPSHSFVVEPGKYDLMAGASSADARLQDQVRAIRAPAL